MRRLALPCLLLLAACGAGADPVAEDANTASLPAPPPGNASDPTGAAPAGTATVPARPAAHPDHAARAIPAALHGRWGLTPADCTRPDASGRLTVSGSDLHFYESHAVPKSNIEAAPDRFSADFAFTGEGQSWTRFQTLQLQGETLVRTESTPMASYTYARCR